MRKIVALMLPGLRLCSLTDAELMPNLAALAAQGMATEMTPSCPAVTCTVQASITTGAPPRTHGVLGNGLLDPAAGRVVLWLMPDRFVGAPRLWTKLAGRAKTMVLFLQNTRGATPDVLLTPAPKHTPDGGIEMDCESRPEAFYAAMVEQIGHFDLRDYWGPMASIKCSEWVVEAALHALGHYAPDLSFVYIPHLDYSAQKFGPDAEPTLDEHEAIDRLLGDFMRRAREIDGDVKFAVIGEYAMTPVVDAVLPNVALADAALLSLKPTDAGALPDLSGSRAFALADHQVALVYVPAEGDVARTRDVLSRLPGVARILGRDELADLDMDSPRAPALVAFTEPDRWFGYPWWTDPAAAPSFARTVDIHRKPGYDPLELFWDFKQNAVPLDPTLVRGSHGLPPALGGVRPGVVLPAGAEPPSDGELHDWQLAGVLERLLGV